MTALRRLRRSPGGLVALLALVIAACTNDDGPPAGSGPDERPSSGPDPRDAGAAAPRADGGESNEDSGGPADERDAGDAAPPGRVRGLVGVGYGGLRIASRDGGATWTSRASEQNGGGDDFALLRAVAYANGKWLATGWSQTTSLDGVTWTPLQRINQAGGATWTGASDCQLVEGMTSDGDAFYAACGSPLRIFRSTDASTWSAIGTIGDLGGHPALAHRDGTFYAYGDAGTSYRSTNGVTWTLDASLTQATYCEGVWKSRTACHGASFWDGFFFQSEWQSRVTRSVDGQTFTTVHDDPSNNTLYQPRAMAAGWVAP